MNSNEEIIQNLTTVYTALNNISVCGKGNLNNLMGSINIIEEVIKILNQRAIATATKENEEAAPAKK